MIKKHENMLIITAFFMVLAMLIAFGMGLLGCKSPYEPCSAELNYRCNGPIIEVCDGESWRPEGRNCSQVWGGGAETVYECVEYDTDAECRVVE